MRRFAAATDAITARHGLTPQRYDVLALLHAAPNRTCTASELAARLEVSPSGLTELISRAQRAGLLERVPDAADTRVKHIKATPEGTKRYSGAVIELRPERAHLLSIIKDLAETAAALATPAQRRGDAH